MADPARKDAPPAAPAARPTPTPHEFALWSGFEGREEVLGRGLMQLLKTVIADQPYQHHMNDAALKAHLVAIQFAKNNNMLPQLVAHDVQTLAPVNKRVGALVQQTGNPEYGLIGMFERTDCWYQLVLDYQVEPGRRTWRSPFHTVLAMGRRIGQFDLTEQEIHEQWTTPRLLGYAGTIGIRIRVSPWQADGRLSCELAG